LDKFKIIIKGLAGGLFLIFGSIYLPIYGNTPEIGGLLFFIAVLGIIVSRLFKRFVGAVSLVAFALIIYGGTFIPSYPINTITAFILATVLCGTGVSLLGYGDYIKKAWDWIKNLIGRIKKR